MGRHAVGIMNGNFRNGDYFHYAQSVSNNSPELCVNCGERKSLPMYLVGKTDLCFGCYEIAKETEQATVAEQVTKEAAEVLNWLGNEKLSTGTQKLIAAGCLDANGNLIPYKRAGRRETPLAAEDVTDYYGEDGFDF